VGSRQFTPTPEENELHQRAMRIFLSIGSLGFLPIFSFDSSKHFCEKILTIKTNAAEQVKTIFCTNVQNPVS